MHHHHLPAVALFVALSLSSLAHAESGRVVTVGEVITMTLEHSPDLAAAVVEARRAGLEVTSERSRYTPLFTASAGWLHRETPSLRTGGVDVAGSDDVALAAGIAHTFAWGTSIAAELTMNGAGRDFIQPDSAAVLRLGPTYGLGLRVQVDQPLLRGLGRELGEAGLRRARSVKTAAELARQQTASEAVQTVMTAYWEVWYEQAAVAIQRQALIVAERQLRDATIRRDAGTLADYDLLPLKTEVATIREALSEVEGRLRQRQIALGAPVGGHQRLVAAEPAPMAAASRWDDATIVEAATANNYAVARQAALVFQAGVDASVAGDAALTQLDLSAWLAFEGLGDRDPGGALSMLATAEAVSGYIGLSLELPLDTTARDSDAARARLAVDAARKRQQAVTEAVVASALQTLETLRTTERRLTFARETTAIARESAEGQRVRFEGGIATATELVVAEQLRRQAELRVARAQADLAIAVISLEHTAGTLLETAAGLTSQAPSER